MARLKIFKGNDITKEIPSAAGYIHVTENLILNQPNYDLFKNPANKNQRPAWLNTYAGAENGVPLVVFQTPGVGNPVQITNINCEIDVNEDKKQPAGVGAKSKFHITYPPDHPLNVNYLKPYVETIGSILFDSNVPDIQVRLENACKFLFGVMLLTRCR